MEKHELSLIRHYLKKTQKQMAQLLGVSLRAIRSFEQGWRQIPIHVERQVLFLLFSYGLKKNTLVNCWKIRGCPKEIKQNCPAWEFKVGHLCWFINGTICHGEVQEDWYKKMRKCRKCEVLKPVLSLVSQR